MSNTEEHAALLAKHSPVLRYDSQGGFAADSPGIVTDRPANALVRADGSTIARPKLTLDFLGASKYGDGTGVRKTDHLDERGRDYAKQAAAMHVAPYRDRIHGHAVAAGDDLWLQYWCFYYYNDKAFLGLGLHEGDWEMTQIRLDAKRVPQAMTFAQHRKAQRCAWRDVERQGSRPVVYVARGSQASYPRAGSHPAPGPNDRADGQGPEVSPTLVVIDDRSPGWVGWPGRWGSTRASNFLESDSPTGPKFHDQWRDPAAFHANAEERPLPRNREASAGPAPPAPTIRAKRVSDDRAVVTYDLSRAPTETQPAALVVSLDGRKDGLPPVTTSVPITGSSGEVELRLDPAKRYTVRASTADHLGTASETVSAPLRR